MKTVYLSGGIQDFSKLEIHDWRELSKKLLNCKTLDPTRIVYDGNPAHLVELEKKDIDESSHVLVYYLRPSVGTSMEVLYAWEKKKIVYIVNVNNLELSPWMTYHSNKVFSKLEEAIEQIKTD